MTTRPAITTTIATALLVAIATLPLRDVFGDWGWVLDVIGAAVLAAALASLVETLRPRLPLPIVVALTVAGAAAWTLFATLSVDDPADGSLAQLRNGVFDGWGALLEDQFPLTDRRSAEVFVTVLAWTASATAVHVAARRRTALAAIGAGAVVLWITAASALPRGLAHPVLGAGVGAMALLAIATITRAPDQRLRARRVVGLTTVIVLSAGLAMLAEAASDPVTQDPFDPRTSRETRVDVVAVPDILSEFGERRGRDDVDDGIDPNARVLSIEDTEISEPLRLRLQVYETYDGERWLPAVAFEDIATFAGPAIAPPGEQVTLSVSLEGVPGPWIPLPDRVIDIDVTDLRWSEETQTAITPAPPESYRVTGTVVSGESGLDGLDAATEDIPERLLDVPDAVPESIREAAAGATASADDAVEAINAITDLVRELGRTESGPPGHSLGRLRDDLAEQRATGAEQIASLHAIMLRTVGIPSRVVVGYRADSPEVTNSDLHIWTEAAFPGFGWVAFEPVPEITDPSTEPPEAPTATTTPPPEDVALEAQELPRELGPGEDPDARVSDPLTRTELTLIAIAAVVLLVVVLIGLRVGRRRSRHHPGVRPDVRVLGAWAELIDRLRELGVRIRRTTTTTDVVALAAETDEMIEDDVRALADLAAEALHAPDVSTPDDADEAWNRLLAVESRIIEVRGRLVVTRRYLDPRVLRHPAPMPPPSRTGRRAPAASR